MIIVTGKQVTQFVGLLQSCITTTGGIFNIVLK